MSTFSITTKNILDTGKDCLVFPLPQDFSFSSQLKDCAKKYFPSLKSVMKQRKFTGAAGAVLILPVSEGEKSIHLIFVGLGDGQEGVIDIEQYRRSLGRVVRTLEGLKLTSFALLLPSAKLFSVTQQELGQETVIITQMAAYQYDDFLTAKDRIVGADYDVTLCIDSKSNAATLAGVKKGQVIAESVNLARCWVDTPPSKLTPPDLALQAKQIAKETGLKITVFNESKIAQMGMGGLLGVSRGSDVDCQLVIMEYSCGKKNAPTLGFVGKGITFDSGGLSLKPPAYMETMKEDMSGAAAVLATMKAIAALKPNVNIIGVTPLSENLPSGKATKPGDVVTFYNGKTAEVKNTDAEGRLVLADALSYVVKHYKLDALIDLATLTGACAYALGPYFTGLMSQHPELTDKVFDAAQRCGDRVWELPLDDDYKPAIKSEIADICNIGSKSYMAGAVTAGFFLQNFVEDVPWVHLDIAGTAFNVPNISYFRREGATGVGVRLLVDLAMNWKK